MDLLDGSSSSSKSSGSSFWQSVTGGADSAVKEITGPSYNYAKYIKTPSQLKMGSKPDQLANNVAGIMDYVTILTEGGGPASKAGELPLGNRYFLETGGQCKTSAGDVVKRSLYINNVPDGTIPFLSELSVKIDSFKGLVPGILGDLDELNPVHLFSAFTESSTTPCSNINMSVIDSNNIESTASGFVLDSEVKRLTPCAFANSVNPLTKQTCKESFITANNNLRAKKNRSRKRQTRRNVYNLNNKPLANVYTALVSGLMVYIIYKLVSK